MAANKSCWQLSADNSRDLRFTRYPYAQHIRTGRALTAQGQLHLLFVLYFCCCFVVFFGDEITASPPTSTSTSTPIRSEPNRTEPCGRVEAPETRHQGLIVAALSAPSAHPAAANQMSPLRMNLAEPSLVQPQSVTN